MNPRPEEEPDSILLADDGEREQPATGAAGAAGIEDTGDEGLTNDGNANEAPNDQQEDPDSIIDPAQEGPSDPENLGDAGPPEPELRDAGAFSSESLDGGGFD